MTTDIQIKVQNLNKNKDSYLFYSFIVAVFLLFFVRDALKINFNSYIFLLLLAVVIPFLSNTQIVSISVALPIFGNGIQDNYLVLLIIIALIIKNRSTISINMQILLLLFIIVHEIIHAYIYQFDVMEYLRDILSYVLLFVILFTKGLNLDFNAIKKAFVISLTYLIILLLLMSLIEYKWDVSQFVSSGLRFGFTKFDSDNNLILSLNQNYLGLLVILGLQIILFSQVFSKKTSFIIALLLLMSGLLTQSRTFVILLLLTFISIIITSRLRKSITFVSLFTILLLAFSLTNLDVVDNIIVRFHYQDISNGRIDIFRQYNDLFYNNFKVFLLGTGIQNSKVIIDEGLINSPHNIFQESILIWGFIGPVIVVILFIMIIMKIYNSKRDYDVNLTPLIALFLYLQVAQILRAESSLLLFIIATLGCLITKKRNDNYEI